MFIRNINSNCFSVRIYTIRRKNRKIRRFLQDETSVDLKLPGTEGCTVLHLLSGMETRIEKEDIFTYLLALGADPNARSFDELTPVHLAAMWNNCWELEKLLQCGGNPWLTDNENKNSFDLAIDNHAYETYQLLHRYLSEEKLNFRNWIPKSQCSNHLYLTDDNKEVSQYESEYNGFCTANENFPIYFSSTDDEMSDHFINVSKMLKKNLNRTRRELSPRKRRENKNLINASLNKSSVTKAEIILPADSDSSRYSIDIKVTKKTTFKPINVDSSSESTDVYSTSENEFIVPECESNETLLECDNRSGIALVEKCTESSDSFVYHKCRVSTTGQEQPSLSGWKSFTSNNSSLWSDSVCPSHSNSFIVPDELKAYSNSQILQELQDLGDDPGPVSSATRDVYLRRLARLKNGCYAFCKLPEPKFCKEFYLFLEGKLDTDHIQKLINQVNEEFNQLDPTFKWREGNQRHCFNYFLLDPRVTQNLPNRLKELSFAEVFLLFCDALFYVGKGTKGRPYDHLMEAAKAGANNEEKNPKISHILDIWNSGFGVISLHCFNNSIPIEAYTQEACIIEAIGLKNLTNLKPGNFYGKVSKWRRSVKRSVGLGLLHKALQIYILEGEKQILPKDIRIRL